MKKEEGARPGAAALAAMEVTVWVPRTRVARAATAPDPTAPTLAAPPPEPLATADNAPAAAAPPPPRVTPAAPARDTAEAWTDLARTVAACTRCPLHEGRTQTVFGVGRRDADWLVIGEAPGAEEDRRGEPFVGRAGQLLNAMLRALDLGRDDVYIANILKCRPPSNRDPKPEEVACCESYLAAQIELVSPRIILAVGRIAAQNLLKVQTPIGKLRGQRHAYGPRGIPLVVTYHPAYLLRSPAEKRRAWQDLAFARQVCEESA